MTLDEISVVFTADTAPFAAAVAQVTALLTAASQQADGLIDAFSAAGSQAGDGLARGIQSRQSHVAAAAQAVAAAADLSSLSAAFSGAGSRAGEGLAGGILSRQGSIVSAARQVAAAAAAALKNALDIHSPSRVTYQTGALFDAGLIDGIAGSARQVEMEAAALGHTAAAALSPHLPDDSGFVPPAPAAGPGREDTPLQINLTVPLEIDGYRLGVAAIEGIQQVQGGSGRIELDL